MFLYNLYPYIANKVTIKHDHEYILTSWLYVHITGKKYVKNENRNPTLSPKSFLICVYPSIPNIAIANTEKSLNAIILLPKIIHTICNIQ